MLHNGVIHQSIFDIMIFQSFHFDSKLQFNLIRNKNEHCLNLLQGYNVSVAA